MPHVPSIYHQLKDPLALQQELWPEVEFYDKQVEIIYSVRDNDETYVPAANKVGKDFVAGFIALWFFLTHEEVRVITTSVKDDHLRVLWGELGRFYRSSRRPLDATMGGPLIYNHRDIRKVRKGVRCEISYLRGMVSETGEGISGHHAASTLLVVDEASGVDDSVYLFSDAWAGGGGEGGNRKRKLILGNCNPTQNFFRRAVEAGDLLAKR
jgi:hypothetical protein